MGASFSQRPAGAALVVIDYCAAPTDLLARTASVHGAHGLPRRTLEKSRKRNDIPGGWVYHIAGQFDPADAVPREAIVGAWKVDPQGRIVGDFIENKNYDPVRWPPGAKPE